MDTKTEQEIQQVEQKSSIMDNVQQKTITETKSTGFKEYKHYAPEDTFSIGGYVQSLAVSFLFIGIIAYVLISIKKRGLRNLFSKKQFSLKKNESFTVKQRYQIDTKKYFFVVQFLNEEMLLGVTDMGVSVIAKAPTEGKEQHEQNVEKFNVLMENMEKE